jgi:predicted transcriptional regulator
MTTTSLKLPEALKQRATQAAQQLGISPHAFMVSAIEQAATATEQRARFIDDAQLARREMIETAKGFDADDVHAYLKAKVSGKNATKPKARSWHA